MKKAILVLMALGLAVQAQARAKTINGTEAIQVIRNSFLGDRSGIEQGEAHNGKSCSVAMKDDGDSLEIVVSIDEQVVQSLVFSTEDSYKYTNDEESDGSYKKVIGNKHQSIHLVTMDDAYEMLKTVADGQSVDCDVYF